VAAIYGFRNTTASDIVIDGSFTVRAMSIATFYNAESGTAYDVLAIQRSMVGSSTGVNAKLASGDLIFIIDGIEQTATSFYAWWSSFMRNVIDVRDTAPIPTKVDSGAVCSSSSELKAKVATNPSAASGTGFFLAPTNTDSTLSVSSTDTLISACDRTNLYCTKPGFTLGNWTVYNDALGSTITPADVPAMAAAMGASGYLSVSMALLGNSAAAQYPYGGVSFDLTNNNGAATGSKATVDISDYTGITITYTSTKAIKLQLEGNADTDGANFFYTLPIAATQTTVTVLWTQFAQPGWVSGAQIRTKPLSNCCTIKFQYDTEQTACEFVLYDVRFKGTGPFISAPTALNAKYTAATYALINKWFNSYYEENGTQTMGRIKWVSGDTPDPTLTVSEGISYGMMLAVIASRSTATSDTYRKRFDRMWAYYNFYADGNGLMHWKVSGFNGTVVGNNAATDADLVVAKALILAYERWMDVSYLTAARALMTRIWNKEVVSVVTTTGGTRLLLAPGDSWASQFNPSYVMLTTLKLFQYYDTDVSHAWSTVHADQLWYLAANQTSNGAAAYWLPSNWTDKDGVDYVQSWSNEGFGWDSCRTLYHIAEAYYWYGDAGAYAYLNKIATAPTLVTKMTTAPWDIQLSIKLDGTMGQRYNNTTSTWSAEPVGGYSSAALKDD
jgi:endo-1,4-beta-D-glucanase Y